MSMWIEASAAVCCAVCFFGTVGSARGETPSPAATAQTLDETALPLVPLPERVIRKPGSFSLTKATRISAPERLRGIAERFRDDVRPATGFSLSVGGSGTITLVLDSKLKDLGEEGYKLSVTPRKVTVRAFGPAGVFYGLQTFRQLLPAAIFRQAATQTAWEAPCVEIEDRPRFKWRGSHMDVGRHFQARETLFKHLDLLALHKLNVFHWHLTEDQGWRIEIKKYPKLTSVGSRRKDTALGPPPHGEGAKFTGWKFAGRPHAGFYTQDDVREVVRYAADRFITVVPEIEMPGHARAAVAAYPELGNTGKPVEVATTWGVFNEVYGVEDRTLTFIKDVLTEVLALFPSKFIHVGGDECPKTEWKASPAAQARMKALGLKNEEELQSWFIKQIDAWLTERGRRLIGWNEILQGGLAPGAAVMSWQGEEGGIAAARAGHDVVMAPEDYVYLDHAQAKGPQEPVSIGGFTPIEQVYSYDPIPKGLSPTEAAHILGAQAQLWTEYIPNGRHLEYMAWPRLCALAEVVWSPQAARDFRRFEARLAPHLDRLKILDVNFRPYTGVAIESSK
jgi:hexosaminidase